MIRFARLGRWCALLVLLAAVLAPAGYAQDSNGQDTAGSSDTSSDGGFSQNEVLDKARGFFGETTEGLARAIERVFEDLGRPNAIITGEEASGAVGVGLRYGEGLLERKEGGSAKVYWQGPSVGFDFGGNAARVFTLVYDLGPTDEIYQRFPGVDGSAYFIAGLSVNYQKSGNVVLAPIRTGVGLRLGASVGYLHYTREASWVPF